MPRRPHTGKTFDLSPFLCLFVFFVANSASSQAAEPTYWQDVRPILRKSCTVCHNPKQLREPEISGGLRLDTYDAVLEWKEKKKKLVQPGKSRESLLHQVVVTTDTEKRMPLGANPLSAEAIGVLARWIDSGAPEGERPAETPVAPPRVVRTRKLDVLLHTTTLPPVTAFPGMSRGPLTLSLKVGPLAPVVALAFHPDGQRLATGAYGRVTLWDLTTGQPLRVLTNVLGAVNDLRFSPDGSLLAVAGGQPSAKGDLRLFQVGDWKLKAVLPGHDDVVNSVAFRADGKKLASASYDRTARIWDVETGKSEKTLTLHSDFVTSVAFSPDGKFVFTGSKDRSVRMIDATTGASKLTFSDRNEDVLSLAAHVNGKALVVTGLEPGLSWWNTETGARTQSAGGHRGAVHELAFSRDGKLLVSAGADGTVKVWNGDTGVLLRSITVGPLVYAAAISADGKQAAAGCFDGLVRVYDAATGTARITLLSLPAMEEKSDWLAQTSQGYTIGSESLLSGGIWIMNGKAVPAAMVWKAMRRPEAVLLSLRGQKVDEPVFGK